MIPEAAIEAAISAVQQETYGAEWARRMATIAVQAAAPHMLASSWGAGFRAGSDHGADPFHPPTPNPYR